MNVLTNFIGRAGIAAAAFGQTGEPQPIPKKAQVTQSQESLKSEGPILFAPQQTPTVLPKTLARPGQFTDPSGIWTQPGKTNQSTNPQAIQPTPAKTIVNPQEELQNSMEKLGKLVNCEISKQGTNADKLLVLLQAVENKSASIQGRKPVNYGMPNTPLDPYAPVLGLAKEIPTSIGFSFIPEKHPFKNIRILDNPATPGLDRSKGNDDSVALGVAKLLNQASNVLESNIRTHQQFIDGIPQGEPLPSNKFSNFGRN